MEETGRQGSRNLSPFSFWFKNVFSKIKEAEGFKRAKILHAEGEAEAIKLVNEAADKYFVGNAQLLKKLETVETSLERNAKIGIPTGSELVNIIGDMAGIVLLIKKSKKD